MRQAFAVAVLVIAYALFYLLTGSGLSLSWVVRDGDADREAVKGTRSWVLWLERTTFGDDVRRWHALNSAATVSDCDANLAATIKLQTSKSAPGETVERKGDSLFFGSVAHGHASVSRYVCLRDTIDPRGPNAK
jgi:hypothetical protein